MTNTAKIISKKVNNHDNFSSLAEKLLNVFPSSRIFASGGFLFDVYHDNEPHDFDPAIYGVTFERLVKGIRDIYESGTIKPDKKTVHFEHEGKQVDLHLLIPVVKNPVDKTEILNDRYQFQLESATNFNSYIEECSSADNIISSAGNIFAEYGSEKVFYNSEKNLEHLNNKILHVSEAERLRFSADPLFRCIKNASTGFSFEEKTYDVMINHNKLDFILWQDSKDERDIKSLLEDRFLSTLHRVEKQRFYLEGDREGDFSTFVNLCDKSQVLNSVLNVQQKKSNDNYENKEEVLLHLFGNHMDVEEKFSGNFLFDNFYFKQ